MGHSPRQRRPARTAECGDGRRRRAPNARIPRDNAAQGVQAAATGGWTLHQLRHSALTHLAEANVALPLLMAKSRHTSLRWLHKYARPGVDAVAKLTADHDPARRRP